MTFWIATSWICVGLLTGINIYVFLKFKKLSDQVLKTAFPGAKNLDQLSRMMSNMEALRNPKASSQSDLKAAMEFLQKMKKS